MSILYFFRAFPIIFLLPSLSILAKILLFFTLFIYETWCLFMEYFLYDFHQGGAGKPNKASRRNCPTFVKYPQLPTLKISFKFSISKKLETYLKHWSFRMEFIDFFWKCFSLWIFHGSWSGWFSGFLCFGFRNFCRVCYLGVEDGWKFRKFILQIYEAGVWFTKI
jgi:hypothetical protein